jgi:hypothetical protein
MHWDCCKIKDAGLSDREKNPSLGGEVFPLAIQQKAGRTCGGGCVTVAIRLL